MGESTWVCGWIHELTVGHARVDISKLGLKDLRSKISIIPQEVGFVPLLH